MKKLKIPFTLLLVAVVVTLSRCGKDPSECSSCPPPEVGTPYDFQVPEGFPQPFIPADNPLTEEGVELGRFLFYDKQLSANYSMSCGSCHMQSNAFADQLGAAKSTGIYGEKTRRNAMVLFNLAFQDEFFWDGRVSSLEEQSIHPIKDTIEFANSVDSVIARLEKDPIYPPLFEDAFGSSEINEERIGKAIAQFERIIISADSEYDQVKRLGGPNNQFTEDPGTRGSKNEGFRMFNTEEGDCFHCHQPVNHLFGSFVGQPDDLFFRNNGLSTQQELDASAADRGREEVTGDAGDRGKFKIPSVRNVEFSFPYMHDGSIPDLDSLIDFYNFGGHPSATVDSINMTALGSGHEWSRSQKDDLLAFLKTLTDYSFLEDPRYADPFQ